MKFKLMTKIWKFGQKINLRMELCIMVNGLGIKNMDMEYKHGLMVRGMRVCGKIIKHVAKENSGM